MKAALQAVLESRDLTRVCLCGPRGRNRVQQRDILAVIGAIQAAGHDPEDIVAKVRKMDSGRLSGFILDPSLEHFGACVPADLLCLAAEGLAAQ